MISLGDVKVDSTVNIPFNTFDSDGASVTVTNLVAGDVHIHKDGGTTQRSSSAGITVSIDFDGITGNHLITIDLSDNTDVGFYASGSDYDVRLEGITVDTQTLNVWVGNFSIENRVSDIVKISGDATAADNLEATYDGTGYDNAVAPAQQQQVTNLTQGSSGISTISTTAVIATGSETGTYLNTHERDSVYHQITDAAGTTDLYYEFQVGTTGVPASVTFYGRSNGGNDDIDVYGYNWGTTSWEQLGTIQGKNQATNDELTFSMYNTHVGSGSDSGKVRVRFYNTGLTTANLYVDQLYVSYAVVGSVVGYANGQIWIDTVNGTSGAVTDVNGVADNPVDNWADALIISGNTSLTTFNIANGSSITLTGNSDYYTLLGANWSLALGGQSIANTSITGAEVTGISSGANFEMFSCKLGDGTGVTAENGFFIQCAMSGDFTFSGAGTYYFDQCFSGVAGTATPSIDFGAAVANTNVNFRHYSGGLEIKNMGQAGTDTMSLEGWGQYVINANCVSGTLAVRGHFKKTDNSGNAVLIADDANFKTSVVNSGIAQGAGTGSNQIQLAATASSTDGAYDPAMIMIVTGTGAGQSRLILQYAGATRTATVDRNWKVNPDSTSEYRVIAHPGREHVNEGLAQAGAATTITLNPLASGDDNAYVDQLVFVRSGTGEDQVRRVSAYDGTTKIATISSAWDVNPDSTSGYVMLPSLTYDKTGYSISGTKQTLDDLNDIAVNDIATHVVEGTLTLEQVLRIMLSALALKSSGGGTSSITFRDVADLKNRIAGTVDANNNRTSVTLDGA